MRFQRFVVTNPALFGALAALAVITLLNFWVPSIENVSMRAATGGVLLVSFFLGLAGWMSLDTSLLAGSMFSWFCGIWIPKAAGWYALYFLLFGFLAVIMF